MNINHACYSGFPPTCYIAWEPSPTHSDDANHLRLSEPLLTQIGTDNIVTINNFGAQVLNSRNLFIADVDLAQDDKESGSPSLVTAIHAVTRLAKRDRLGLRIYETRGGLRIICFSKPLVMNDYAARLLKSLRSDPRYLHLCEVTGTYRARLSPKLPGQFTCTSTFKAGSYSRTNENVASRVFLVVESDVLDRDTIGSVFRWMREGVGLPLRCIVDTAGKSLHGWFDFPTPERLDELRVVLPELGCDPKMFGASQPCRLPGALRDGRYQKLIFLGKGGAA